MRLIDQVGLEMHHGVLGSHLDSWETCDGVRGINDVFA